MGKGLKQVKAGKGRGTEKTASEVWLGEGTPIQLVPLLVQRLSPGPILGALEVGAPCLLPLLPAHTEAPLTFPNPRLTPNGCL